MCSLISGVIAELVLQKLERIALRDYHPKLWARYVDDTFVKIYQGWLATIQNTLNEAFPVSWFTMEEDSSCELSVMEVLVIHRMDGSLTNSQETKETENERVYDVFNPNLWPAGCIHRCAKPNIRSPGEHEEHGQRKQIMWPKLIWVNWGKSEVVYSINWMNCETIYVSETAK